MRFLFSAVLFAFFPFVLFAAQLTTESLEGKWIFTHMILDGESRRTVNRTMEFLPDGKVVNYDKAGKEAGRAEPESWWTMRHASELGSREPFGGSDDEAVESLDQHFRDAVRLRLEADVPLGVFLSGGIDSSTVAALAQVQSSQPIRTFSIGFEEADYDEAPHAKAVARHLGTDHTECYVTPSEAREVIPSLPKLYDEPFGDSSQIPTALLCRIARRHVTVCLSGDGGDELFCGYNRYFHIRRLWRCIGWCPRGLRRMTAPLARLLAGVAPSATLTRKARSLAYWVEPASRQAAYAYFNTHIHHHT